MTNPALPVYDSQNLFIIFLNASTIKYLGYLIINYIILMQENYLVLSIKIILALLNS